MLENEIYSLIQSLKVERGLWKADYALARETPS
jgi:hypothetical protein